MMASLLSPHVGRYSAESMSVHRAAYSMMHLIRRCLLERVLQSVKEQALAYHSPGRLLGPLLGLRRSAVFAVFALAAVSRGGGRRRGAAIPARDTMRGARAAASGRQTRGLALAPGRRKRRRRRRGPQEGKTQRLQGGRSVHVSRHPVAGGRASNFCWLCAGIKMRREEGRNHGMEATVNHPRTPN